MIVVCGEALIDFVPVKCGDATGYIPRPGGSPYNVAVGLARLQVPASFLGKMSRDRFGRMLIQNLAENGVERHLIVYSNRPTPLAFVFPGEEEHEFQFYGSDTAEQSLRLDELPASLPSETRAVHFGSYSLVIGETAHTLEQFMGRANGAVVVSLDPNARPAMFPNRREYVRRIERLIPLATLVKVSRADIAWLYPNESIERIARMWLERGPALVVVTLGSEGAMAITASSEVKASGVVVDVADTVGAGDAFTSALLAFFYHHGMLGADAIARSRETALADALRFANRAAALSCARPGAAPPYSSELEA